jgi:hypothetical protein
MFVVDHIKAATNDCSDIISDSRDYATHINQSPYGYTVPLSEKLTNIGRIEMLDRKVPHCARYKFSVPMLATQTIEQAERCVPVMMYSSYDGVPLIRAIIYRFGAFIDGTENGIMKKREAFAVPVMGLFDPSFAADTLNLTCKFFQEPYAGAGTTIGYTRGLTDTDVSYLQMVNTTIEIKLSISPDTVFKQQFTTSVDKDTFWISDHTAFFFLNNVNINRYLERKLNTDYVSITILEEGLPYVPPFQVDYTTTPPTIIYEPNFFHFRFYFQRKFY